MSGIEIHGTGHIPAGVLPFAEAVARMAETRGIERLAMELEQDPKNPEGETVKLYWERDQQPKLKESKG